mmetsp:Transcript_24420/g.76577  ORF Transcript_24420/g.76577 Transcript_24420/m.76577 type:complete len:336 (-) Transcript_24420:175-1182(-)
MASYADNDIHGMSVKQLKAYIQAAGLPLSGCVEKSDLIRRAEEAKERYSANPTLGQTQAPPPGQTQAPPRPGGGAFFQKRETVGGFDTILAGTGACEPGKAGAEQPDLLVVLMHGFGATAEDFADLPRMFQVSAGGFAAHKVVFAFPQARIGSVGVPAWWEIDVQRWIMSKFMGDEALVSLVQETPEGLPAAREDIGNFVQAAMALFGGVSYKRVAIGGFSQGAITALDLALHQPEAGGAKLGGVFQLSGAPVATPEWDARMAADASLSEIPVFITHGTSDEVLPIAGAAMCRALLEKYGFNVTYVEHNDGHTLGPSHVIEGFLSFLHGVRERGA